MGKVFDPKNIVWETEEPRNFQDSKSLNDEY